MEVLTQFLENDTATKYIKKYSWIDTFEVKQWLNKLMQRCKGKHGFTYDNFKSQINRLKRYLRFTGMTPTELIDEAERDADLPRREKRNPAGTRIKTFYNELFNKYSSDYAEATASSVRSFYSHNGFPTDVYIPQGSPEKPKIALTKEIIKELLLLIPQLRNQLIILIMSCSGMSITDVLDLRYRDIYEELKANKKPLCIKFRRTKNNRNYLTFLSHECVNLLNLYLKQRALENMEDFLFLNQRGVQLTERSFRPILNRASKKLIGDTRINTKSFRRFFTTEMKGSGISSDLVEFMAGRNIGVARDYLNAERLRPIYERGEMYVTIMTTIVKQKADEVREEVRNEFARELAQKDQETKKLRNELNMIVKTMESLALKVNELSAKSNISS